MSVRIFYSDSDYADFCEHTPLQRQLAGAQQVFMSTEDDDGRSALCFLSKLRDASQLIVFPPIKINFKKSNTICDARLARDLKKLGTKLLLTWTMQRIVYGQARIDKKIDGIMEMVKDIGA